MNYVVVVEYATTNPMKATFGPFPGHATATAWADAYVAQHKGVIEYRVERLQKPLEYPTSGGSR